MFDGGRTHSLSAMTIIHNTTCSCKRQGFMIRSGRAVEWLVAWLVVICQLEAAPITWTASSVSGPADVSSAGTLVGAFNAGTNATQVVNGVAFAADSGGLGPHTLGTCSVTFSFDGGISANFWTQADPGGDPDYHSVLDSARQSIGGGRDGTIALAGLVIGRTYQVQLWILDTRTPDLNTRVRTVKGDEASAF
ncbi:MAG: hypothetical protein RLZZ476_156, partial [Verrucomicrobiota bacterium]